MLVDSNILIYALNADSVKHERAKSFLQNNLGNLQIAHQNLLETLRVVTHKTFKQKPTLKEAADAILLLTQSFQILTPNINTYFLCIELIKEYDVSSNRIFDAYLAATAMTNDVWEIATDNERDFSKIKEIKVINPFIEGENKES